MGRFLENCAYFAECFPFLEGLTTDYSPEKLVSERKDKQEHLGVVFSCV